MKLTYGEQIARVLDGLFVDGRPAPTVAQVAAAYPFGKEKHLAAMWMQKVAERRKAHRARGAA